MNKIGLSLAALAFALVIPFSTAHASGNGSWECQPSPDNCIGFKIVENSVGGYYWTQPPDGSDYNHFWVSSTGGDFMVEAVVLFSYPVYAMRLWEYDPGPGNDDAVGWEYFTQKSNGYNSAVFRNSDWDLDSYRDGTNNKAEFYIRTFASEYDGLLVKYFD